jgi:hypothetical protein
MHSGAMGSTPIFEKSFESTLLPHSLHALLLAKAKANLGNKTSIRRQYHHQDRDPIARMSSEDEFSSGHVSGRPSPVEPPTHPTRNRTESLVKFADGYDTNGERFLSAPDSMSRGHESRIPQNPLKTNITASTSTPDTLLADTTGTTRRPPRPHLVHYPPDDLLATPTQENPPDEVFSTENYTERWTSASSDGFPELVDNPVRLQKEASALVVARDRFGNERAVSIDNPYLLHENPAPFVPTTSTSYDSADDPKMSPDTENDRFHQQYGDLFDGDGPTLLQSDERQQLLNQGQLERGDYHSASGRRNRQHKQPNQGF